MTRYLYEFCESPICLAKRSRKKTRNVSLETGFWRCHRCGATGRDDLGNAKRPRSDRDDSRYITKVIATSAFLTDETVAARYLARRGFAGHSGRSRDLLAHAELRHGPSDQDFPALVGVVRDERTIVVGVHRTYLTADGSKAPVEPTRMALGRVGGGAIRIDPVRPWDGTVAIVEGIEDALGLRLLRPSWWVWAALSANGMRAVRIPPQYRRVVIGPDLDDSGEGQRACNELRARLRLSKHEVEVFYPQGHDFGEVGLSSVRPR